MGPGISHFVINQSSYQLTGYVIHLDRNLTVDRNSVLNGSVWIERIRVILIQTIVIWKNERNRVSRNSLISSIFY